MGGKHRQRTGDTSDVVAYMSSLIRRRQYATAVRLADSVELSEPGAIHAPFRFLYGIALDMTGRCSDAEQQFRDAWLCADYNPMTEAAACCVLARAKTAAGDTARSGELLVHAERLLRDSPRIIMVYRAKADVASANGNFYAAAWWHEKAAREWAASASDDLAEATANLFGWLKALAQARQPCTQVYAVLTMTPLSHSHRRLARLYRYFGIYGVRYGDWLEETARIVAPACDTPLWIKP